MKTIKQIIKDYYIQNGMSEQQANKAYEYLVEQMKDTFNNFDSPMEQYSKMLQDLILLTAKQSAFEWLTINKPEAWFISIFKS